jgi:4-methylaminobutanoate oxidase (formaldehyde-forming)
VLSGREAGKIWPLIRTDDVVGAVFLPNDGKTSPVDTTQALARGARSRGARIFENTRATDILVENSRATGLRTEFGEIHAEHVVNYGGMWGRSIGGWSNVGIRCMPPDISTSSPSRCRA